MTISSAQNRFQNYKYAKYKFLTGVFVPAKRRELVFTFLGLLVGHNFFRVLPVFTEKSSNSSPISNGYFGRTTKALGSPFCKFITRFLTHEAQETLSLSHSEASKAKSAAIQG
jgi:hypothetical protein